MEIVKKHIFSLCQALWRDFGLRHSCAALHLFPILSEFRIQSGRGLPQSKDSLSLIIIPIESGTINHFFDS